MALGASAHDVLWTCILVGAWLALLLGVAVADDIRRRVQDWRRRGRR